MFRLIALAAGMNAAAVASGQTFVETFDFATDDANATLTAPQFDDLGGLRELRSVTFSASWTFAADVLLTNNSDAVYEPSNSGEVWVDGAVTIAPRSPSGAAIDTLGDARRVATVPFILGDEIVIGAPRLGIGQTADLGRVEIERQTALSFFTRLTDFNGNEIDVAGPITDPAVVGDGLLSVDSSAFGSAAFFDPSVIDIGRFEAELSNVEATLTVSVSYSFDIIPAPPSFALLAAAGGFAVRRRRQ